MNDLVTVNSISGGKTSAFMAIHYPTDINIFACVCIDDPNCATKDPALLKYVLNKLDGNFIASAEHDKTLRVVMQLEQLLGKEIVWVRGKSFDEVIDNAGCLPTWNRRFCTTDMKIIPMFEYLYPRYGVTKQNIGFRYDEWERGFEIEKGKPPVKKTVGLMKYPMSCKNFGQKMQNWKEFQWQEKNYPLIDGVVFHQTIRKFWENKPEFNFPVDSNCRGCHHKPSWLIKKNFEETPEILEWFSKQELKGKYNTWHDDLIPYREIFKKEYNDLFSDTLDFPMCNSGGCTD